MRVAAIFDIHANLPALEAVLQEIRQEKVDRVVVGGDVLPGPLPVESLRCLADLDIPAQFIRGNGERVVLAQRTGGDISEVPEPYREIIRWTARQLGAHQAQWLSSWPVTCGLEVTGLGRVLFCHATPRDDNECFTRLTPEERLRPTFEGLDARLVVCGHTHMQFDRTIGDVRVANAGSVGMPFGEPGADWLLLGPDVQFRHTSYDLSKAAERIRRTDYPQADAFAAGHVLQPPSGIVMLEAFTKASLR